MENIKNVHEIQRGLLKACDRPLMEKISALDDIEKFYRDIFNLYGLEYNTETLEQKRFFIGDATKYFLFGRLPRGLVKINHEGENRNKYSSQTPYIGEHLNTVIKTFFSIYDACNSSEEFLQKYAEYYNVEIRNFGNVLRINRDDTLSNFAKAVKQIYNNSKEEK